MYRIEHLVSSDQLNRDAGLPLPDNSLGLVPDWQFYPNPPPVGTGKFEQVQVPVDNCPSWGITENGYTPNGYLNGPSGLNDIELKLGGSGLALFAFIPLIGASLAGYHGYKRNDGDVGAAALWAIIGAFFPTHTFAYALGQGYGKEKRGA